MKKLLLALGVIFLAFPAYAQSTFYSNSTTGKVGIGTTNPQSLLQVYGGEVQVGTSGAACSATNAGALRYSGGSAYVCDSANWDVFGGSSGGTLPALTSGDIWVGNGSNVATAVSLSGDCTISNAGAITCTKTSGISFGTLATLSSVNLASQVTGNLPSANLPTLTSADIWVGNGSNAATAVAMSGDCTISNAGAITCTKTNGTAFGTLATQFGVNLSTQATGTLQAGQFPALSGDVTTTAGGLATTVAAIQGTTVSGTTGTGNAVFSASPTLTGAVSAGSSTWSGNVGIGTATASNPLTVNGIIQSLTGGFKFPDGTTQTTAATSGSTVNVQTFTSSGTWTKPSGATTVFVQCWGGGGGGAGCYSGTGGGGGGGFEAERWYSASALSSTESVVVGSGGSGTCGSTAGNGGNSSFSSSGNLLTAYGGAGGANNSGGVGGGSTSTGGPGSGGLTSGSNAAWMNGGGNGGVGLPGGPNVNGGSSYSGGGGGAGYNSGSAVGGSSVNGGAGGNDGGSGVGGAGSVPSGGGGTSGSTLGGSGARGQCIAISS